MKYYGRNKNVKNIKKFRTNIQRNNLNYTISHFVIQEKLQISLKYSNKQSDEILEYTNFYSLHQLQIINRYFRNFNSLEQIANDLDKKLKENQVSIEEKNGFIVITITVLLNGETSDIIFKLLQNRVMDYNKSRNTKIISPNNFDKYKGVKNSLSLSRSDFNEVKNKINDLYDRISVLESSQNNRSPYTGIEPINKNRSYLRDNNAIRNSCNTVDVNINENRMILNNMNSILARINKLEDLNIEKEKRIKELEDEVSKYEVNNNNSMNYPLYSPLENYYRLSNIKNEYNINLENRNKYYEREFEIEINSSSSEDKKKKKRKLRNNKNKNRSVDSKNEEKQYRYFFKPIEESKEQSHRNIYSNKDNDSIKANKRNSKQRGIGNKSKSQNILHSHHSHPSRSIKEEEKVNKREENKVNEERNSKNEKKPITERIEINSADYNKEDNAETTGLPMPDREDLKNYINSRIFFTTKELQMVKKRIAKGNNKLHVYFDILYRASIDGDFEDGINYCTDGQYPQLILFYTYEGARFGVYIEKQKYTGFFGNIKYKEVPGTSFIVSLNSLKTYNILEGQTATEDREERLSFGRSFYFNDNGSNWFIYTPRNNFLDAKCMIGNKESTFGNINTNEIVGTKKVYKIKEVEIFKVIIDSEDI